MAAPPNLLFLFSDQHSARVAGCYGDGLAHTPALDGLAAEGVTFDAAYCPSPLCTPSRMSAMTARQPHRTGVWGNQDVLHSGLPTFAHSLGAAGLDPVLIGRLHSLGPDQHLGYADREVGDHHPNWLGLPRLDMGPLQGTASPDRRSLRNSGRGQSAYEVKDEDVTEAALARLDRIAADIASGRRERFAMTVGLMLPHAPFVARPDDYAKFEGRVGLASPRAPSPDDDHPWLAAWRKTTDIESVTEAEELRSRAAYYGLVTAMDRMIGRLLKRLDALGLADNTLVVYASDHGEQIGAHGLWWKHTFYEASVRVPIIMRWPARLPAGQRRAQVVNLTDLTSTMLDAMDAPPLPDACGLSFLGVAQDATAPWIDRTFSEYCQASQMDWAPAGTTVNRMIRDGRYKLNYYHGYPPQLFDLAEDPDEERDLASSRRHAAVRDALTAEVLRGWDPDAIARRLESGLAAKSLMADWARVTEPPSTCFWPMRAELNRLDAAE